MPGADYVSVDVSRRNGARRSDHSGIYGRGNRAHAKAYSAEEKQKLIEASREARSPTIYPAVMLALNAGMRVPRFSTCVGT